MVHTQTVCVNSLVSAQRHHENIWNYVLSVRFEGTLYTADIVAVLRGT